MQLPPRLAKLLKSDTPIYALSPHIDDVIWSAGGVLHALAAQGRHITLVSIFSHSIYVYDKAWPPAEATAIRKSEDYTAARAAGFKDVIFLDFPDGILRDTPQTSVINSAYQTPPYLLKLVTDCLVHIIPQTATVLAPAAFGGHMDHLTTRRAALALPHAKALYQDMPYGTRRQRNDEALTFLSKGWELANIPLTPAVIKKHLELFWHYHSQTSEEVASEIRGHLTKQGLSLWFPIGQHPLA